MKSLCRQLQDDDFPHFQDWHKVSNLSRIRFPILVLWRDISQQGWSLCRWSRCLTAEQTLKRPHCAGITRHSLNCHSPPPSRTLNIFRKSHDALSPESLLYSYLCQESADNSPEEYSGRSHKVPRDEVAGIIAHIRAKKTNRSRKLMTSPIWL